MIPLERQGELEAIATEIFEALGGAGWAPTDKGCEAVVAILGRAKARMWTDSPAERRDLAIARRTWRVKKVAERILGKGGK